MNFMNNIKSAFMTTDKIKWVDINSIKIDPELEGIFVQKETEIQNIATNMADHGFDPAHPIILAYSKEHPELNNINADGMTRYKASKRCGLSKVAIIYKEFSNREELLKFVYEQQLLRRNLTEGEIYNAWSALNRLTNEDGKKAKSDSEIAEELKISRRQVSKMKEVEKKASPEVLESIKAGALTVNKAYTQIKKKEAKTDDAATPLEESNDKSNDVVTKTFKTSNTDYITGYSDGWMYVLESIRFGKPQRELQSELSELKEGSKTVESLQTSLRALKVSYEQNQTE